MNAWLEFYGSQVPPIDWYYTLKNKKTRLEERLTPKFCERPHREIIAGNAEHVVYAFIAWFGTRFVGLYLTSLVGLLAIGLIIPFEFWLFRAFDFYFYETEKKHLFRDIKARLLLLVASRNMLNITCYWIIGSAIALL